MEVWRQTFRNFSKFAEAANGNLSTSQISCRSRTAMSEGPILREVWLIFDDEMMILSIVGMNIELYSANWGNGPSFRQGRYRTRHSIRRPDEIALKDREPKLQKGTTLNPIPVGPIPA
jgi:hypothetical protein